MLELFEYYPYLLPLVIFFGRILDVSLGTLRIIFVSKGQKHLAPIIGFFEVFIWIVVISQILAQTQGLLAYVSYAAGYAAGNYVGIILEGKIAFGIVVCRIYTNKDPQPLVRLLSEHGYGVTRMEGMGAKMKVSIIEAVVERKALKSINRFIMDFDKDTFYTAEDVRVRQRGVFPKSLMFKRWRPGK